MNRSYRIKTNIGSDQVLNVNLKQDIDIYEILSLKLGKNKLSPEGLSVNNMYKMYSADYGVIVGRVLANDAFGVPNAKISVFIPLTKEDKASRRDIRAIYPFNFVTDVDKRNVKYNTLPNYKKFECHQAVGSFPNKRLVLDDDSVLELYDKYYKYTTVTNNAGDYMLFGIPTGQQILHMDVDLSDIGVLSQEPRDFIYKGYSPNLFESPTQFKKSTNLDDLPQIQNQSTSVNVYPLWGDKNSAEIAITRKDITLQYKFEPTCVFMGSVVTDNGINSIGYNCIPDEGVGEADQFVTSKGDIEMIRKTVDDKVEEFQIKGNQLIDADGTWCYQIPMNLDYVGMDEYGNIVPTNNPNKGIPTRTRVRFRITLDESGNETQTTHKARYLIPNNPNLCEDLIEPNVSREILDNDLYYEFGTLTPDECFRDLYWNKVYSVKNYIPRIQMSKRESASNYLAIKGVNKKGAIKNNLMPYNKINANLSIPSYMILSLLGYDTHSWLYQFWFMFKRFSKEFSTDEVLEKVIEENDGLSLDFYNDWLNGCLYFPAWFWHIRKKKDYKKGESVYESSFCECKREESNAMPSYLYLFTNSSLLYSQLPGENNDLVLVTGEEGGSFTPGKNIYKGYENNYTAMPYGSRGFFGGLIKKVTNKDGADAFYYTFGNRLILTGEGPNENVVTVIDDGETRREFYKYVRLFSTDIILLGSLKENDIDGVPKMQNSFPSTTAIIPPVGKYKNQDGVKIKVGEEDKEVNGDDETNLISYNGMNWGKLWYEKSDYEDFIERFFKVSLKKKKEYKYNLGSGLFFGIYQSGGEIRIYTDFKTPVNVERICELGVSLDSETIMPISCRENGSYEFNNVAYKNEMDGLITKREIEDVDSRSLFATLNYNKLIGTIENYNTGYKKYNIISLYPSDFDGRLENIAPEYTTYEDNPPITFDYRCKDYLDFRFGSKRLEDEEALSTISYRGLSFLYNGRKRKKIDVEFNNINIEGHNGVVYNVGDGAVRINRPADNKIRHFYGFTNRSNEQVDIEESSKSQVNPRGYRNMFPLYENSFYFYFGLNQGSTAIEKFYEQFYSECKDDSVDMFKMSIEVTPSDACTDNGGKIVIDVEEIEFPFSVDVIRQGDEEPIQTIGGLKDSKVTIEGLENGQYTLIVTDAYGNFMEEEAVLKYQKVELGFVVDRTIMTEYFNQTTAEIYNSDTHGKLKFTSYTLYGEEVAITELVGSNGVYTVDNKIKITLTPEEGQFSDYIFNGHEIDSSAKTTVNICKPSTFGVEVRELCEGEECGNVSYYSITVNDVRNLEMYVNEVPLKYLVNKKETVLPYNEYFYGNGDYEQGSIANVNSIKGWFGVHNPAIYSDIFKANMEKPSESATEETKKEYETNLLLWFRDIYSEEIIDIVNAKFKYMFALSNATYVTAGNKNSFSVNLRGGSGNLLLRSGFPIYDDFNNKYVNGERNSVTCNDKYANIVSENYTGTTVAGYDFNGLYDTKTKNAGNYFAGFSNNANIIQIDSDNCILSTSNKPYQTIPFKTDSLCSPDTDNNCTLLCLNGEKIDNKILPEITTQHDTYKKYFRTEFIDRRFDYDVVVITGHKCNHFGETEDTWNKARFSALTYNGIEMLYNGDNKSIISTGNNTEYKYDLTNSNVELNLDTSKRKRFYSTKLYYGNNNYIDLVNAFDYNCSTNPTAVGANVITGHDTGSTEFDFFGFYGATPLIHGYPMKRWLGIKDVPYSDRYTFTNVSCAYNGIEVIADDDVITASAVPGETVSFTVDANEIVNIIPVEYNQDEYNILFTLQGGDFKANTLNELSFRVTPNYVDENFETKTTGITLCKDDSVHTALKAIKTGLTDPSFAGGLTPSGSIPNLVDTTETFKNNVFKVSGSIGGAESLFFAIDRKFTNIANDFLKKSIRVINTSTVYNISKFGFSGGVIRQVDYTATIPAESINVNVETSGGGSGTGTATNADAGETYPVSVTVGVTTNGNGTNQNEVEGTMKKDYCEFTISSEYLASCLSDMRFNITVGSVKANYSVGNGVSILSTTNNSIRIGILLAQHTQLVSEAGTASLRGYFKVSDEIKSENGDGYLVFAFDYNFN